MTSCEPNMQSQRTRAFGPRASYERVYLPSWYGGWWDGGLIVVGRLAGCSQGQAVLSAFAALACALW